MVAEGYVHPYVPSLAETHAEPATSSGSTGSPVEQVVCSLRKPAMVAAGTWEARICEHLSKKSLNASAHLASQVVGTPSPHVVAAADHVHNPSE